MVQRHLTTFKADVTTYRATNSVQTFARLDAYTAECSSSLARQTQAHTATLQAEYTSLATALAEDLDDTFRIQLSNWTDTAHAYWQDHHTQFIAQTATSVQACHAQVQLAVDQSIANVLREPNRQRFSDSIKSEITAATSTALAKLEASSTIFQTDASSLFQRQQTTLNTALAAVNAQRNSLSNELTSAFETRLQTVRDRELHLDQLGATEIQQIQSAGNIGMTEIRQAQQQALSDMDYSFGRFATTPTFTTCVRKIMDTRSPRPVPEPDPSDHGDDPSDNDDDAYRTDDDDDDNSHVSEMYNDDHRRHDRRQGRRDHDSDRRPIGDCIARAIHEKKTADLREKNLNKNLKYFLDANPAYSFPDTAILPSQDQMEGLYRDIYSEMRLKELPIVQLSDLIATKCTLPTDHPFTHEQIRKISDCLYARLTNITATTNTVVLSRLKPFEQERDGYGALWHLMTPTFVLAGAPTGLLR